MTSMQSLSVFVTERLTLAAQEIFKAVEVTVSEYHQEISRSRQENELLKRRLLEAGIDLYPELQPNMPSMPIMHDGDGDAGQGPPACGEQWGQTSEEIQVKLELSAAQERLQDAPSQIAVANEPVSPKPCLQNEQKMEDMFQSQTAETSMDALLLAGPYVQVKQEPNELVSNLGPQTLCDVQSCIPAYPNDAAAASGHTSGLGGEMDSHRMSSVHKPGRSKMLRRKRRRVEPSIDGVSTEKTFLVESLLKSCNFRQKLRYHVSVDEIKRRVGPPEFMSINGLVSYLRTSKSNKVSLRNVLTGVGVVPSQSTRLTSLCSKLTEDEAADLATDLEKLACSFIDFKMAAEAWRSSKNKMAELSRTKAFREFLTHTKKALAPFMGWYDTVTHGLGPKTFDVTVQIMDTYLKQVTQQLSEELRS